MKKNSKQSSTKVKNSMNKNTKNCKSCKSTKNSVVGFEDESKSFEYDSELFITFSTVLRNLLVGIAIISFRVDVFTMHPSRLKINMCVRS